MSCPNCSSQGKQSKAGFNHSGSQRYQCGQCKRIYTPKPNSNGYAAETWMLAVRMYVEGNGYNAIGRILKVNPQSVVNWVKHYMTCPPRINPKFKLGLENGDRNQCQENISPQNRSLAN